MPGLGELVARLSADDLDLTERRRLLLALARAVGSGARLAGASAAASGRWLVDLVVDEVAPHVPVRDLLTLREHHGGLSGDELASSLVRRAAAATAALGAAGGALVAVETAAPPTLLAAPVQLTAQTVAVIAVELKLVAELHVVYGQAPKGPPSQVAVAYLTAWSGRQAVDSHGSGPSLSSLLTTVARQQLRRRIVRRLGRNLSSLVPFLAGAVAGAELNRRETQALGAALTGELRRRR